MFGVSLKKLINTQIPQLHSYYIDMKVYEKCLSFQTSDHRSTTLCITAWQGAWDRDPEEWQRRDVAWALNRGHRGGHTSGIKWQLWRWRWLYDLHVCWNHDDDSSMQRFYHSFSFYYCCFFLTTGLHTEPAICRYILQLHSFLTRTWWVLRSVLNEYLVSSCWVEHYSKFFSVYWTPRDYFFMCLVLNGTQTGYGYN